VGNLAIPKQKAIEYQGNYSLDSSSKYMGLQQNKVYPTVLKPHIVNIKALQVTSTFCWQTVMGGGQSRNSKATRDWKLCMKRAE